MKDSLFKKIVSLDWASTVDKVNANSEYISKIYNVLKKKLRNPFINEEVLNLSACMLESNNILFYRAANYRHYQEISASIFKRLSDLSNINNKELFYRVCFAGVYTDYFKDKAKEKKLYEKKLEEGLRYFVKTYHEAKTYKSLCNYFLALIHVSQHCLFKGSTYKNYQFLEKAKSLLLDKGKELNVNYRAFFYYHYSWSFFERHSYKKALKVVDELLELKGACISQPITLHAMNIKCAILYALKKYKECFALATTVSQYAAKVFSSNNQDVYAESLLNIAKCLTKKGFNLAKAKTSTEKAISILTKLFLGPKIDPSQALAHIVLGDVYEKLRKKEDALKHFKIAKDIYENIYQTNVKRNRGYLKLIRKINEFGEV